MGKIMKGKNIKNLILSRANVNTTEECCNCRNKTECPLNGICKVEGMVYRTTIKQEKSSEENIYWIHGGQFLRKGGTITDPVLNQQGTGIIQNLPVLYRP